MRGRKPRAPEEKLARGETRPSRVNYEAPEVPEPADLDPPKDLRGAGFRLWRDYARAAKDAGQLRATDIPLFASWCKTASAIETYERRAKAGNDQAMRLLIQLNSLFLRQAAELGFTAVARSRVKTTIKPAVEKPKHERFFGGLRVVSGGRK